MTVVAQQAKLELSAETVSIHKSGIEFRSPTAFKEWSEMTVSIQTSATGESFSASGVIVACSGNKHSGFHISMLFTDLTPQSQARLSALAHASFSGI